MAQKTIASQLVPTEGNDLQDIFNTIKQPAGYSRLTTVQRRQLVAAILASVIPSDGKVRDVEIKHFVSHLQQKYQFAVHDQKVALSFMRNGLTPEQLKLAAKLLQELLSADDRTKLIGLMWDVAMSDQELHSEEERLIYLVADLAGVVRKRADEEQSRAASANGMAA